MSSYSYAQDWPGRGARGSKSRHGGGPRHGQGPEREGGRYGGGRHGGGRHGHGRHGDLGGIAELLGNLSFARGKGRHGPGRGPSPEDIEDLIALRRMGGGPFGRPGPFGGGPRGGGRGRGRARRGDVRLALLRLLAEDPRNGYQLMQTIEERSGGHWRPSPGSVYPTLAQLEDEGLIRSAESDGSRRFEITDAGREHLQTRAQEPDPWTPTQEESENSLTEIGPLVIGIGKAAWQVASAGDEGQQARAVELLAETRRGLYRILAEDQAQSAESGEAEPDESGESAG
jgi:DNA-binding PadR family transcriptional regulator